MILNIGLWILMIVMVISYFGIIIKKYGVLRSLSDSVYELPTRFKWLFPGFMGLFGIFMMIIANNWLADITGICFFMVGIAYDFRKSNLINTIHLIGAFLGVITSQLYIIFIINQPWISLCFFASALLTTFISSLCKNTIWWQELLVFISAIVSLGILIF